LKHVEGLRALAAYVVFVNHAYAQVWNPGRAQAPPRLLSPFAYSLVAGHLSVTVFIVISGFCLTIPVVAGADRLRGGAGDFFKRRARRILPPYYGAVALSLLLIRTIIGTATGTLWDVPIRVSTASLVSHLLLLQDLFGTGAINYVFWSIAVEWQIYFLFPTLVWSWRRYGPTATVLCALALGYAARLALAGTRVERACPHYLGLFALGMLAAYLARSPSPGYARARARWPWAWGALAGVAATCALTGAWGWQTARARSYVLDLAMGASAMCVLVLTTRSSGLLTRLLSWRPLVFIGTFSYSVYLIHAPLLQVIWQYVLWPWRLGSVSMFAALMGPGALVVLAASYAFFRVFEEPFLRKSSVRAAGAIEVVQAQPPTT